MTTYRELKAKAGELLKQAETLRTKEVPTVIAQIKAAMVEYGISLDDLREPAKRVAKAGPKAASKAVKRKRTTVSKPKYRNPETGATWTGHGKPPNWLKEAEAKGKKRESFLIGEG